MKFKNTSIASFLSLALITTSFIFFTQLDAAIGATFSIERKRDSTHTDFMMTIINHSSTEIYYKRDGKMTEIPPGDTKVKEFIHSGDSKAMRKKARIIYIKGKKDPRFEFSEHSSGWSDKQDIFPLPLNGYKIKGLNSKISEITGNGFRITVDGGGIDDPNTEEIYIQVYDD